MASAGSMIHEAGTNDGWHGVIKEGGEFPPEKGRYHLYIGLFCPFAHRANLVRYIKGLTEYIDISVVKPYPKGDDNGWPGWKFPKTDDEYPGATVDHLFGSEYMHEIYFKADKEYKGRYSVPLLWDRTNGTIVNNESAELLRWLPTAFISLRDHDVADLDLYPPKHHAAIDRISVWMQDHLNTGVYKAGFAPEQESYDKNVVQVFAALNKLEEIIHEKGGPYILGQDMTELDIRAYATIIRFDTVYVQHFKCNLGTIRHDYPNINNWLKNLYWNVPGYKESTDFKHIKENYTKSHGDINPKAITPMGPFPDVEEGVVENFSKLRVGAVKLDVVLEYQKKLDDNTAFMQTTQSLCKIDTCPKPIDSTTTMKRKATCSLTEPGAKRAHHIVPSDVPLRLQDSLASKLDLVNQHITSLTKPNADDQESNGEDNVEQALVIKLSLAPRLLAAFPHKVNKNARTTYSPLPAPPRDRLPLHGTLKFLELPPALLDKIYQDAVEPTNLRQLLQEILGIRSPLQRLEWLFTCKDFLHEARSHAFSKVPFHVRPFNTQAVLVHSNGHRITDLKGKEPWKDQVLLKKGIFRIGIDHDYFVIDKFMALQNKVGLIKHVCHSMPVTGLTAYQEDLDWTPFGMDLACGSYSTKRGTVKLELDKLTLVTNGFPLGHWNRTSKRPITEDLAAWVLSSIVEHKTIKKVNVIIADRRYVEKVKNAKSPLAQREVAMDVNLLRKELNEMLELIVARSWLTDESGEQIWSVEWVLKGGLWCWECRARIGMRVVDVVVADVAEIEGLGIDFS
ncbi:glutathione S-transferase [Venturia nashicola]|nr:glutathione S-transferase [Venturia nashicola]